MRPGQETQRAKENLHANSDETQTKWRERHGSTTCSGGNFYRLIDVTNVACENGGRLFHPAAYKQALHE